MRLVIFGSGALVAALGAGWAYSASGVDANELMVEAAQTWSAAEAVGTAYGKAAERLRLLDAVEVNLQRIVKEAPGSDLAVTLVTGGTVGPLSTAAVSDAKAAAVAAVREDERIAGIIAKGGPEARFYAPTQECLVEIAAQEIDKSPDYWLAFQFWQAGSPEQAIAVLEEISDLHLDGEVRFYESFVTSFGPGDLTLESVELLAAFLRSLDEPADRARTLIGLCTACGYFGPMEPAADLLEEVASLTAEVEHKATRAELLEALGVLAMSIDDTDRAMRLHEETAALRGDPQANRLPLILHAITAPSDLAADLSASRYSDQIRVRAAAVLAHLGRDEEATQVITGMQEAPDVVPARLLLAAYLARIGEAEKAMAMLGDMDLDADRDIFSVERLVSHLAVTGHPDSGRAVLNRLIPAHDPQLSTIQFVAMARSDLAHAFMGADRTDDARMEVEAGLSLAGAETREPDLAGILSLAGILARMGKSDEARVLYDQARNSFSDDTDSQLEKRIAIGLARGGDGRAAMTKALEMDPGPERGDLALAVAVALGKAS